MRDKWEAIIQFRPGMMSNVVYLVCEQYGRRVYLKSSGEIYEAKEGKYPKEEDVQFAVLNEDQLRALSDAISRNGYKAPDQHLIEGKLQATERHLDDMRSIVFKRTPENRCTLTTKGQT